jgi:hypothetical protein
LGGSPLFRAGFDRALQIRFERASRGAVDRRESSFGCTERYATVALTVELLATGLTTMLYLAVVARYGAPPTRPQSAQATAWAWSCGVAIGMLVRSATTNPEFLSRVVTGMLWSPRMSMSAFHVLSNGAFTGVASRRTGGPGPARGSSAPW